MTKRILFTGDSVTDCLRIREEFYDMGTGFALLVKAALSYDHPGEYEYINRGLGGNRSVDLYARIKKDFINLKPDYASILIGVNDVWHEIGGQDGVDTPKFEKIYTMLLDEIYKACPDIKIILLAPFVLEGTATANTEEDPDRLAKFRQGVAEKAAVTKKIAQMYHLPCIDLQAAFDKVCENSEPVLWAWDGVHPTACGSELIKRLWLEAFETIK